MTTVKQVLVTVRFFDDEAVAMLEEAGLQVIRADDVAHDAIDNTITPGLTKALASASAWIVGAAPVSKGLLEGHPGLLAIARRGVGYDSVDTAAVSTLGRVLSITPGCNEPAVSDHAVGLMLAVGRRIVEHSLNMRRGDWKVRVGTEVFAKTVGLIGFGRIARGVVRRLRGFDVEVLAHDPFFDAGVGRELGVTACDLPTLLAASDIVSLHAPLTPETHGMMGGKQIGVMKPGAIVINTSRGELIDEHALLKALQERRLGGAGLDVFLSEHQPEFRALSQELVEFPTVVATPHLGGSTAESLRRANTMAAKCVIAALNGAPLPPNCSVVDARGSANLNN